ncbi:MAG TPA: sigma 54-interacting transcriptional regulator, partial [Gemmataceae bacterium]
SKNIQVKLLRFLESGEIRRVGDNKPFKTDVRVLCATNRGLREMVERGDFREDLLYRLNTFEIHLPALRDRLADLPELARHLLARAAKRPAEQVAHLLTPQAIDAMSEYAWPGNVRELANAMEYAYIVAGGGPITDAHLPHSVRAGRGRPVPVAPAPGKGVAAAPPPPSGPKTLRDIEMEHILRVLEKNNRNKQQTAAELGISLKTLYNKLNAYEEERRRAAG